MLAAKAPVEVRISGDSIETLKRVANQIARNARAIQGVTWVRDDYEQPLHSLRVNVRQDEANRLGYSRTLLAYP